MNYKERSSFLLKKYPEIKDFPTVCHELKYSMLFLFFLSQICSYLSHFTNYYFFFCYLVGGTVINSNSLGMHEIIHFNAFKNINYNKYLSIFCDLTFGLPICESFRRYHKHHHNDFSVVNKDPDLPSNFEIKYFNGKIGKLIWLFFQGLFYIFRPLTIKQFDTTYFQRISIVCCIIRFLLFWHYLSIYAALFPIISAVLGTGIHPLSGHFITEHYYHNDKNETTSYYGWMNLLTFNAGYHIEHHDFPNIPGSYLPKLHSIVKEYKNNPKVDSWVKNLCYFIIDDKFTLNNRVKYSE